jgi:hypothetical protein
LRGLETINSIKDAYQYFCDLTQNVITSGDFRTHPVKLSKPLQNAGYFVFQGDGYCTSMAFLQQAFVKKVTGCEIGCGYCRTKDGLYTHAYNFKNDELFDSALKLNTSFDNLDKVMPAGWFYTMVKRAGMLIFDGLHSSSDWIFDEISLENMSFMKSGNHQLVYLPEARPYNVFKVFVETMKNQSTTMSIEKDDFDWKRKYREISSEISGQDQFRFLSCLDGVEFKLPVGASLYLPGGEKRTLPRILEEIYYGKILLELEVNLTKGESLDVSGFPSPWLISSEDINQIKIDGKTYDFHSYENELTGYLGQGDFGRNLRKVSIDSPGRIIFHIPFNNLYLQSANANIHFSGNLSDRGVWHG